MLFRSKDRSCHFLSGEQSGRKSDHYVYGSGKGRHPRQGRYGNHSLKNRSGHKQCKNRVQSCYYIYKDSFVPGLFLLNALQIQKYMILKCTPLFSFNTHSVIKKFRLLQHDEQCTDHNTKIGYIKDQLPDSFHRNIHPEIIHHIKIGRASCRDRVSLCV